MDAAASSSDCGLTRVMTGLMVCTYPSVDQYCLAVNEPVAHKKQGQGTHIPYRPAVRRFFPGYNGRLRRWDLEVLFLILRDMRQANRVGGARCSHLCLEQAYMQWCKPDVLSRTEHYIPGAMPFTRIPSGSSSFASVAVACPIAAFENMYGYDRPAVLMSLP